MSIESKNGGTTLSEEELQRIDEAGLSEAQRDAYIEDFLSRISDNAEEIAANQEKIREREEKEEGLTEDKVKQLIEDHAVTPNELKGNEQVVNRDTAVLDAVDENSTVSRTAVNTPDAANLGGQGEHSDGEDATGEISTPPSGQASLAREILAIIVSKRVPIQYATCAGLLFLAFALSNPLFGLLSLFLMIATAMHYDKW
jgi:hypothetical protein